MPMRWLFLFCLLLPAALAAQQPVLQNPAAGALHRGGDRVELRWQGTKPNRTLRLSITLDGTNWVQLHDKVPDTGSFALTLPREDSARAQLRLAAEDGAGLSPEFFLDSTAPVTIADGEARIVAGFIELSATAFDPRSLRPVTRIELCTGPAPDRLTTLAVLQGGQGLLRARAPGPGRHDLYLLAVDEAGNREAKTAPDVTGLLVDSTSPTGRVEVRPAARYVVGGDEVTVAWTCEDAELEAASVVLDLGLADRWVPLPGGARASGECTFVVPPVAAKGARVRLRAGDAAGNLLETFSAGFDIFPARPFAVIGGDEDVAEGIRFRVEFSGREWLNGNGVPWQVDLWRGDLQNGGKVRWEPVPFARNLALDADRRFLYTGDRARKTFAVTLYVPGEPALSEPAPSTERDTEAVTLFGQMRMEGVALDTPMLQAPLKPGDSLRLTWVNPPSPRLGYTLDLEYSTDGGRTFAVVAANLDVTENRATGEHRWTVPEGIRGGSVMLRTITTAPNRGTRATIARPLLSPVAVDAAPPLGRLGRPRLETGATLRQPAPGSGVRYPVEAVDMDGVAAFAELWARPRGGTWRRVSRASVAELLPADGLADGAHDLVLVLEDNHGNRSPEPAGDELISATLEVDATPPRLVARAGAMNAGEGAGLPLEWDARDEVGLAAQPVHLQGSLDGGTTWLPLAAAQGAAGRTELKLDVLAPTRLLVRVLARDRAGNAAMADLGEAVFTPPLPLDAIPDLLERLDSRRVRLGWHARPDGVPASRYAQLELWRSLDRGQTWALSRANEAAGTWAAGAHADLPEGEGVAWFRLCGITEGGRREAAPAAGDLPELEVAYDTQAPVVKATLEPAGPVFAPGDRPTLLVQAEDTNLDPAGGRVELWTTEGLAATIPLASAGGGAFSAVLDLPGSGGDVRIVAVIRDALGNEGRAECLARLPLLGTLESVGLEGNAPAYTDTRRLVIWRYGNSQGHLGSGGLAWLWAEDRQGKRTLLGAELPDDGDWLWPRLPSAPGEYRLVLETLPPSEARRRSVASEWFNVLRSAPLLELLAPEGPTEETLREYPLRLRLTQDGNSYGIPLARVRVQWRLRGREKWESDAIELVAGPDAWRGELPAVEQRVTFMPFHGEGGYDVRVSAEDIYGNTSPAAEGSVWFDLRRPVAELDVSTAAEGMLRARWSAEDATLDPEGIRLETATGGPEGWGPWQALDLGRSPGGLSRLNGATEFAAPGALTRVRLTVRDRAGRVTMLESSRGAVAGGPGYRAARAVETLPDALAGEAYAGPGYSRRARFDVLIEAEAGFAAEPSGVTLFWRRAGESAWHETPGIGRGVRRVPFAAPASGLYQFVAVARSQDGRTDQPVRRDGDGGMPAFSDSEVEAEIWVDAVTFRVEVATFPSAPVQPDNTRTVLPGTTRAGETAELVFDLLHGLRAAELEVQLDLSLDAGQTWAPLAIPRHGVLKEALGAGSDDPYLQRVRWRVPLVMPQQATGCAQVRITALETGRLASGRAVALTPLFEIRNADGTLPKAAPGPLYAARLKAGDAAAAAGDDTEAVKCWLEAMRNLRGNVEPELEQRLAQAYERLGDAAAARHHGSRAAR